MHPTIMARRQLEAQNQIMDAATLLAKQNNVTPPAQVQQRDAGVAQMLKFEEIAKFLSDLATTNKGADSSKIVSEVLAIEGLSKGSTEKIRAHFEMDDDDGDTE